MLHVVGLPHTGFDEYRFSACAFTAKAVRLSRMLAMAGRDHLSYWGGASGLAVVSCLSEERQLDHFGEWSASQLPSIVWDPRLDYWREFHANVIREIDARIEPGDLVAVVGGAISQEVVNHYRSRGFLCVEPGVGYEGICTDTFACFESYAWMHNRYGAYGIGNGRALDAVIPNAVDPDDWNFARSEGYALFVGRLIHRKGPHVAAEIARRCGLKLKIAGAGAASVEPGRIVCADGTVIEGDHVEYVGTLIGHERVELFARAEVFLCPTLYIGPWEGVHAEALMSGVAVVAPDYGVFTETVRPDCRYRRMGEAVRAVEIARMLRGYDLRAQAINSFGIDACADMYADWFDRVEAVQDGRGGWYY